MHTGSALIDLKVKPHRRVEQRRKRVCVPMRPGHIDTTALQRGAFPQERFAATTGMYARQGVWVTEASTGAQQLVVCRGNRDPVVRISLHA